MIIILIINARFILAISANILSGNDQVVEYKMLAPYPVGIIKKLRITIIGRKIRSAHLNVSIYTRIWPMGIIKRWIHPTLWNPVIDGIAV